MHKLFKIFNYSQFREKILFYSKVSGLQLCTLPVKSLHINIYYYLGISPGPRSVPLSITVFQVPERWLASV